MSGSPCSLGRHIRGPSRRHRTHGCRLWGPVPRVARPASGSSSSAVGPYGTHFLYRLPGSGVDGHDKKGLNPPAPVTRCGLEGVPPLPHRHPQFGDEPPHPPGRTESLDISDHSQHINVMTRCLLGERCGILSILLGCVLSTIH
jgi:hypothetical protein